MYSSLPTDVRSSHPYFMYDEIREQPAAVRRSLALDSGQAGDAVALLAGARRVFVTACGTSFHAAQLGAWFLRAFSEGKIDARGIQALDIVNYFPGLRPDDVLVAVSHSGTTHMTIRALDCARRLGAESILITGMADGPASSHATHVLTTGYTEEKSWAHTTSYTAALGTFLALSNALAEPTQRVDLEQLPGALAECLQLEELAHRLAASTILAERYQEPVRIVVTGAGPNAITASEAVLKLLETSYVQAASYQLEEILHGPLAAVTPETLAIVIAPTGPSLSRVAELVPAMGAIGCTPVVLTDREGTEAFDQAHQFVLPTLPEILSPLTYVIPLQLFSYFLSVGKGFNPDLIHRDDDRYLKASSEYT